MDQEEFNNLIEQIQSNTYSASCLDLSYKNPNLGQIITILQVLEKNTTITSINFAHNNIGENGAEAIAKALEKNTTITSINLVRSCIGESGAEAIAAMLRTNTTITSINLMNNNIGDNGVIAIVKALEKNTTITSIDLVHNNIGENGVIAIAKALEKNTTITSIDLGTNNIVVKGAKALAKALEKNTTITSIMLMHNNIGENGAEAIAKALEKNTTITYINLGGNDIGENGVIAIAEMLKINTTITFINLGGNDIGVKGAEALAEALEKNTTITSINFAHNNIGVKGAEALAKALEKNTTITSINLVGSRIGENGVIAIAAMLQTNTTITSIEFARYDTGQNGAIAEALKKHPAITEVKGIEIDQALQDVLNFNKIRQQRKTANYIIGILNTEFEKLNANQRAFILHMNDDEKFNSHLQFLSSPQATMKDPLGIVSDNNMIYNAEEIKEVFKRLTSQVKPASYIVGILNTEFEKLNAGQKAFILHINDDEKFNSHLQHINDDEKFNSHLQFLIPFPKLNQTSNFRAKAKECTQKYMYLPATREITKYHLRMGIGISSPQATMKDPVGIVSDNNMIYNAEEIEEVFKRLTSQVKADNKFMSNYYATKFEQQVKFKVVIDAQSDSVSIKNNTNDTAADLNILNNDAAYYIDALQTTESEQANKVIQKQYDVHLNQYVTCVKILKNIGIIAEEASNNNNNDKPLFAIDIAENKLGELKKHSDIDKNVLVTALIEHGANEASVSFIIDTFKPTAEVREASSLTKQENVQEK